MNAITVIAARELRDRSRLFIVAGCMAVLPFLAVMVPAARVNRPVVIASVAAFLAISYSSALALAIGVSMVGGELAEKRFSFYLAKPVGVAAIWFGKVAAALLTIFGTAAIIAIPAWLVARSGWRELWMMGSDELAPLIVAGCVVLLFVGHGLSTIVRSRSPRVAADFVLLGLVVLATLFLARPLTLGGAFNQAGWLALAVAGVFLLALIVGPVWQLWRGRVDARRNHAALSTAIWSVMAVALLAGAGYVFWFTHPPLSAFEHTYRYDQDPAGQWVYVAGTARGRESYFAAFLIDPAGGRERIAVAQRGTAMFSSDGRTMAWMESEGLLRPGRTFRLHTRRLERGANAVATPLSTTSPYLWFLSDDASRVVFLHNGSAEVYETATGRVLAVAPLGRNERDIEAMYFAGPNILRIVDRSGAPGGMRLRELDIARRKLATTGEIQVEGRDRGVSRSADGTRLFFRSTASTYDARTGALLATSPVQPKNAFAATMLSDGTSIVARDGKLYHLDRAGKIAAELPLPLLVRTAWVAGEVGKGKVLMVAPVASKGLDKMLVVDLAARRIVLTMNHVHGPYPRWNSEDMVPRYTEDADLAAQGDKGEPLLWNVRTGKTRRLE
jgi:hypothetical protein